MLGGYGRYFLLAALVAMFCQPCYAEEVSGRLVRVGIDNIVILGTDESQVVLRIDKQERPKAAPFLGRTVKVRILTSDRGPKAIGFSPWMANAARR